MEFIMEQGAPQVIEAWLNLALAGVGLVSGLLQNRRANRLASETVAPTTEISPEVLENQALARQMSLVGLPQEQYNLALQNINRNRGGALRAAATSGRPSSIASILRASDDAVARLDAQNAAARMANQRALMGANTAVANDRNRVFNWDVNQYNAALQQIAGMRRAGTSNVFGALGLLSNMYTMGGWNGLLGRQSGQYQRYPNISGGASYAGFTPTINTTVTAPSTLPYQ